MEDPAQPGMTVVRTWQDAKIFEDTFVAYKPRTRVGEKQLNEFTVDGLNLGYIQEITSEQETLLILYSLKSCMDRAFIGGILSDKTLSKNPLVLRAADGQELLRLEDIMKRNIAELAFHREVGPGKFGLVATNLLYGNGIPERIANQLVQLWEQS